MSDFKVSSKTIRKLEKPRPLKGVCSSDPQLNSLLNDVVLDKQGTSQNSDFVKRMGPLKQTIALANIMSGNIKNKKYCELRQHIQILYSSFKVYGSQLEAGYKNDLNEIFAVFREGHLDEGMDYSIKIVLRKLLQLRARNWHTFDDDPDSPGFCTVDSNTEVLQQLNDFYDNSEEESEDTTSQELRSGYGSCDDGCVCARKSLLVNGIHLEDKKPSEMFKESSISRPSLEEYKCSLTICNQNLEIKGTNANFVKKAKIILQMFFTRNPNIYEEIIKSENGTVPLNNKTNGVTCVDNVTEMPREVRMSDCKTVLKGITYPSSTLLQLATSPHCHITPPNWHRVSRDFPSITKDVFSQMHKND